VIVQYGEPIEVDKYKEEYLSNPQKAMLTLRDEIHERLTPLTMQINSEPFYHDYENIRQIAGESYSKTRQFSKNSALQLFLAENDLIKKLEIAESTQTELFNKLTDKTREYFTSLAGRKISDEMVKNASKAGWAAFLLHCCSFVLTLPIFIAGFLFNAIPFFVPRNLLRKKIKDKAFTSTFYFGSGLVIFPVVYLIEAGILLGVTKSWAIAISLFALMPFLGKLSYKLLIFYQRVLHEIRFLAGNKFFRKNMKALIKQRAELIDLIIR